MVSYFFPWLYLFDLFNGIFHGDFLTLQLGHVVTNSTVSHPIKKVHDNQNKQDESLNVLHTVVLCFVHSHRAETFHDTYTLGKGCDVQMQKKNILSETLVISLA